MIMNVHPRCKRGHVAKQIELTSIIPLKPEFLLSRFWTENALVFKLLKVTVTVTSLKLT